MVWYDDLFMLLSYNKYLYNEMNNRDFLELVAKKWIQKTKKSQTLKCYI